MPPDHRRKPSPLPVVLAEDRPVVRKGLRAVLEREADLVVVGEASAGEQAAGLITERLPSVVVASAGLPRLECLDGLTGCAAPTVGIVVVADRPHAALTHQKRTSLVLEADCAETLADAVRAAARGDVYRSGALLAAADPEGSRVRPVPFDVLTEREALVVRLMARGSSNAELARELGITEATVKAHLTRILRKLGIRSRLQAVVLAYERGLVHPGRGPEAG